MNLSHVVKAEEEDSVVVTVEVEDLALVAEEDLMQLARKRLSSTLGTCHLKPLKIVYEVYLSSMVELRIVSFPLIVIRAKCVDLRL